MLWEQFWFEHLYYFKRFLVLFQCRYYGVLKQNHLCYVIVTVVLHMPFLINLLYLHIFCAALFLDHDKNLELIAGSVCLALLNILLLIHVFWSLVVVKNTICLVQRAIFVEILKLCNWQAHTYISNLKLFYLDDKAISVWGQLSIVIGKLQNNVLQV